MSRLAAVAVLGGVACVCLVLAGTPKADAPASVAARREPALSQPDFLAQAQRYIAASEYWASATRDGLQAPNRRHDLRAWFEPTGVRVHDRTAEGAPQLVEMRLAGIGRGAALASVPAGEVTHREGRVEIRRPGLVEWYENSERGLEQGFTLAERPPGDGSLVVLLAVAGATLAPAGNAVVFESAAGRRLRFGSLVVTDAAGRSLPARFELPALRQLQIAVEDAAARYPLTIDPLLTQAADAAIESEQAGAGLGAVAGAGDVNGDGYADVIVGAQYFDTGVTDGGAAFVFHGSDAGIAANGSPANAASSIAQDQANAYLGFEVASAGDVNGDGYDDVIVAAPGYDTDDGAAFVFHGSATGIVANGTPANANARLESDQDTAVFGVSVASAGDVNGDGYADIIVGAQFWDGAHANGGAAFVFHGSATGIVANGEPADADAMLDSDQAGATFGQSVAGAGDVNGDGYGDVIVGADHYDAGQTNEGVAFVFHGGPGGIGSQSPASADGVLEVNRPSARFGRSVAGAGDVNGDGYADVIVGAHGFAIGSAGEGGAFVFFGGAAGFGSQNLTSVGLWVESNQTNAFLGWDVAGAGDVNGDGYADVIIGARTYDNGDTDEGGAFVFYGAPTLGFRTAANANARLEVDQADALFGTTVAGAGDVNGDGYADVIVGASDYDAGASDEGAAFVYSGGARGIVDGPASSAPTHLQASTFGWYFGTSIASAGDVNGDGYADVIVGAPYYDAGQVGCGAAFVFHGSATGVQDATTSTADARIGCDEDYPYLGESVAGAGDVNGDGYDDVIVGAPYYDSGAAFVHLGGAQGIDGGAAGIRITQFAGVWGLGLGTSVSGAGDVNGDGYGDVIVGAPGYYPPIPQGMALVFYGSSSGIDPSLESWIVAPQSQTQLGNSVASAGDVNGDGYADVIAGASHYDSGESNEGGAFVFHGSASGIDSLVFTSEADAHLESDQVNAFLGTRVAGAGDVNGDGYADVIVGAFNYQAGQGSEGAAFVFHGGATGVGDGTPANADAQLESNTVGGSLGGSVAGAGDVDGDGYADVIVAAFTEFFDGAAYVFRGGAFGVSDGDPETAATTLTMDGSNGIAVASAGDVNGDGFADVMLRSGEDVYVHHGSGDGRPVRVHQLRRVSQPVAPWGTSRETAFGVALTATHPQGRGNVKLEVEACPVGVPFFGAGCVREISPGWTPVPATGSGVELEQSFSDLVEQSLYRWRARVLHAPPTVTQPGITTPAHPAHGPWRRPTAQSVEADIRTGTNDLDGDGIPNETDADDDGDELADLLETGSGVFVSPADPGSDPLDPDSDRDGFWDGWEVSIGADPNDPDEPDMEAPTSNSASQASDQPKYRWRQSGSFRPEFVTPTPLASGNGICSMSVPTESTCLGLSLGSGCIVVGYDFVTPPAPPTSGLACCAWEGECELTCALNTCAVDDCPDKAPGCSGNDLCVNENLDCRTDQAGCDAEQTRLLGLGVPACCFTSAGATAFQWSPSGLQAPVDTDADRFPNPCDNCPVDANADQADGDGDLRGTVCDTHLGDALRCANTDEDACDDCSSGAFDPARDGAPSVPGVTCIPVPEPGAVTSLLAGIALLRALGVRRSRGLRRARTRR